MPPNLRFQQDASFTIVQLTDLHWRNGYAHDIQTRTLIQSVLEAERPDLVVLSGDVIEGSECADPAAAWRQAIQPIEASAIPWAAVFGNHDDDGCLSREELMVVQRSCPLCLSEPGPSQVPGVGNFLLPIQSARDDSLAALLYLLDSGGYARDGSGQYAWITEEQINWFLETSRGLATTNLNHQSGYDSSRCRIPSLAFFHIPLPEFDRVSAEQPIRGWKHEPVCCPRFNSGFFAAACEAGNVMGIFVGHDHLNDYEGTLEGIRLCYGRATGYGSYGSDEFPRGARVIRLREGERAFDTWLRLEDGSVVPRPPVNAPIGQVPDPLF